MTPQEKELLLRDLCARLKYGVKIKIGEYSDYVLYGIIPNADKPIIVSLVEKGIEHHIDVSVETIKPYLRSMSSMTEEETKDLNRAYVDAMNTEGVSATCICAQFYYKRHLDGIGLIPKGLALEAPEGMYKEK